MNKLDEIEGKLGAAYDNESYLDDVLAAVPEMISKIREWESNQKTIEASRPDISAIKDRMKGIPDEGWEVTSYEGRLDARAKDEEEALRIDNFAANARQDIPILIGYVELLEKKLGIPS